jgi:serine/threonine protein kinase
MAQPPDDETWRHVWEIYAAASELAPGERPAFVQQFDCAAEIRSEVLALLGTYLPEGETLPEPPLQAEPEQDASTAVFVSGERIGRYLLLSRLAHGGMGQVFAAHDTELNRLVAMKFLRADLSAGPEMVDHLKHEARALSALNHPNIVTVYEFIESGFGLGIVMEFVEGEVLSSFGNASISMGQLLRIGEQIAEALAAAHNVDIVHRDIKPDNVMLRRDGYVKVLDFGLAHNLEGGPDAIAGLAIGTLRYMSPEQALMGELTGASDIFSTGLVLYELATGIHPFEAATPLEVMHAIATRRPEPASAFGVSLPEGFSELLAAMLAKDPAQRPAAEDVAQRLRALRVTHEYTSR